MKLANRRALSSEDLWAILSDDSHLRKKELPLRTLDSPGGKFFRTRAEPLNRPLIIGDLNLLLHLLDVASESSLLQFFQDFFLLSQSEEPLTGFFNIPREFPFFLFQGPKFIVAPFQELLVGQIFRRLHSLRALLHEFLGTGDPLKNPVLDLFFFLLKLPLKASQTFLR